MPRGNINKTTISWKSIDAFSILDRNVKSDIDYHTLTWEERGLDLDDLVPAQDHLLTGILHKNCNFYFNCENYIYDFRFVGVRFRTIGARLNLEIMVTPFNFTSGKLIQPLEKSFWLSNDVTTR